jgi:hypothetical protein
VDDCAKVLFDHAQNGKNGFLFVGTEAEIVFEKTGENNARTKATNM